MNLLLFLIPFLFLMIVVIWVYMVVELPAGQSLINAICAELKGEKPQIAVRSPHNMWRCGRFSGLPLCCILWYIMIWHPVRMRAAAMLESRFAARKLELFTNWYFDSLNFHHSKHVAYIRCPFCIIIGRVVEAKSCNDHQLCGGC